jgi:hypothetical protein
MDILNLDAPFDEFVKQLRSQRWSPAELTDAASGLQSRIDQIDRQLCSADTGRGLNWKTSVETARKYFNRKLNAVRQTAFSADSTKKLAGGHGFLITFLVSGVHEVIATRRNPAELWADLIAEADAKDGSLPAMLSFLTLTEEAARKLPESIWEPGG